MIVGTRRGASVVIRTSLCFGRTTARPYKGADSLLTTSTMISINYSFEFFKVNNGALLLLRRETREQILSDSTSLLVCSYMKE